MILIKYIKLSNFLSHKNTSLPIYEVQKLLIDGSSGAGKSTLVEAIIWNLYGKGRVDNKNLIFRGEDSAFVSIDFRDTAKKNNVRVVRKITASGKQTLSVFIDNDDDVWVELDVTGLKNIQEWIEKKFIKASYSLFINSVAFPQDNVENFVKQTSAKRKDLLLEIAGVEDYDLFYNRAKEQLTLGESALIRLDAQIADEQTVVDSGKNLKEEVKELNKNLDRVGVLKTNLSSEIERVSADLRKVQEFAGALKDKSEMKSYIDSKIVSLLDDIEFGEKALGRRSQIESELKSLSDIPALLEGRKNAQASINNKIKDINSWYSAYNDLVDKAPQKRDWDGEIGALVKQMSSVINNTDIHCPSINDMVCPKLEAQLQAQTEYFENQIASLKAQKQEHTTLASQYEEKIKQLGPEPHKDAITNLYKENDSLAEEIRGLEAKMQTISAFNAELRSMSSTQEIVNKKREELLDAQKKSNDFAVEISEMQKTVDPEAKKKIEDEINRLNEAFRGASQEEMAIREQLAVKEKFIELADLAKEKLAALKEERSKKHKDVEALKVIKDAFGSRGMKTMIIDYFVPRLEVKINDILGQLSDFRVEIDTQKSSADGEGVVEGLYINIINPQGESMDFASYSGGERLKIIVAISEALASLQNVGFRILDEIFIGLDEESTQNFASVLNKIQDGFSQLFVISHLQTIKDLFDDTINITKSNGVSTINA